MQEIRAKRKLDRLQLLDRAPVVVVRDGREVEVAPGGGGARRRAAGAAGRPDRGRRAAARRAVEADESLLTGESDPVVKDPGDDLRSGSLCVGGRRSPARPRRRRRELRGPAHRRGAPGHDRHDPAAAADRVRRPAGDGPGRADERGDPRAGRARGLHACCGSSRSRRCCPGWCPTACSSSSRSPTPPGAAAIARRGALVQQVNAVESVQQRRRRLHRQDRHPHHRAAHARRGRSRSATGTAGGRRRRSARSPAASAPRTSPPPRWPRRCPARARGPSATRCRSPRRCAGRASRTDDGHLGAGRPGRARRRTPAAAPRRRRRPTRTVRRAAGARPRAVASAAAGLRDARRPPGAARRSSRSRSSRSPTSCAPRSPTRSPGSATDGVALKVLSGDDPRTVAALATRAGLDAGEPVPGAALDGLDDAALDRLVARTTVFGRVAPEQKERIVASLRRQGHYVAMIGDGVNDARALKGAQVGVAMRSGSARHPRRRRHRARRRLLRRAAARPARGPPDHQRHRDVDVRVPGPGRHPGPGHRRGDDARAGLPLLPHPGRADAAHRRRPDACSSPSGPAPRPPDAHLLGNLARFVLPAAVVTAGFGTAVYAFLYEHVTQGFSSGRTPAQVISDFESYTGLIYTDADFTEAAATIGAQTGLSTFVCLASFVLILFLVPPTRFFAAWTRPTDDRRPTLLVVGVVGRVRRRAVRPGAVELLRAHRRRNSVRHSPCCPPSRCGSSRSPPRTGSGCSTVRWGSTRCRRNDRRPGRPRVRRTGASAGRTDQRRSYRSRFMTLSQALTKSRTNFSLASSAEYTSAMPRRIEFEPKTRSTAVAVRTTLPCASRPS